MALPVSARCGSVGAAAERREMPAKQGTRETRKVTDAGQAAVVGDRLAVGEQQVGG
jgi:hypothetical protein